MSNGEKKLKRFCFHKVKAKNKKEGSMTKQTKLFVSSFFFSFLID